MLLFDIFSFAIMERFSQIKEIFLEFGAWVGFWTNCVQLRKRAEQASLWHNRVESLWAQQRPLSKPPLCTERALSVEGSLIISQTQITLFVLLESTFSKNLLSRTVMLDNKGKKDKSKVIRRPTPTAPHRPPINTSSNHLELVAGRGNLQQRSLSPANSSRPHPALASLPNRSKPGHASPSTAASWRSPSSAPTPDLSPHAKTKALGGHKSKTGSGANPEIMKRSLRWETTMMIQISKSGGENP